MLTNGISGRGARQVGVWGEGMIWLGRFRRCFAGRRYETFCDGVVVPFSKAGGMREKPFSSHVSFIFPVKHPRGESLVLSMMDIRGNTTVADWCTNQQHTDHPPDDTCRFFFSFALYCGS